MTARTAGRVRGMGWLRSAFEFLLLPALIVAAWGIYAAATGSFYWPSPVAVAEALAGMWRSETLLRDVLPSAGRALLGLAIAILLGVGAGLVLGRSRRLYAVFAPLLEFARALPPVVVLPVFVLFLGVGDAMKIAMIVFGCVWPILLNTVDGVRSVPSIVWETAGVYQLRGIAAMRHVVLPHALPQIVTGVRIATALGLILMVVSEMFAASSGLGFLVVQSQRTFAIPEMWAGIVTLTMIGLAFTGLLTLVDRRLLAWHRGQREAELAG